MIFTKLQRNHKTILAFLSVCLLAGMILTLLHHHADGGHEDCSVCHLVRQVLGLFICFLISFFGHHLNIQSFFRNLSEKFVQTFFVTGLRDRAPPVLA